MNSKKCEISNWEKIISYINDIKPIYGTVNIDLIFHQGLIKKVKILQKEHVLIIDKNNTQEINNLKGE